MSDDSNSEECCNIDQNTILDYLAVGWTGRTVGFH